MLLKGKNYCLIFSENVRRSSLPGNRLRNGIDLRPVGTGILEWKYNKLAHIPLLYIAYKYLESGLDEPLSYNLIASNKLNFSPIIYSSIEKLTDDASLDVIRRILTKYNDPKYYASAIIFGLLDGNTMMGTGAYLEAGIGTPTSLAELSVKALNIKNGDRVADVCCGRGDFLVKAAMKSRNISFVGYEMNIPVITIAIIRAELLGIDANFMMGDAIYNLVDNNERFDKIFSNYPFGQRISPEIINQLDQRYLARVKTYDWVFIDLICKHLAEKGKGVVIVPNGILWNQTEKSAREYFINKGEIEAVITLPNRMFAPYSSVDTSILILSHNNKAVRFVDASRYSSLSEGGVFHKRLSEKDINAILDSLNNESDNSFDTDNGTIAENDFSLDIRQYKPENMDYKNGVRLKELAQIVRGVDDIKSDYGKKTTRYGLQVLRLSDISDSIIPEELTKLEEIDFSDKYITLQEGDIILSRNPSPVKVALYNHADDGRKVVPSGSLYVIRCNKEKINPLYLTAFFLSPEGVLALENISTGSYIRTIGMGSLENLVVPVASKKHQERIANRIDRAQIEIVIVKERVAHAKQMLRNAYVNEGD